MVSLSLGHLVYVEKGQFTRIYSNDDTFLGKIPALKTALIDLSIFNLLSVFLLVRRMLNYYPNYPTHRSYFGEVEAPYTPHLTFKTDRQIVNTYNLLKHMTFFTVSEKRSFV